MKKNTTFILVSVLCFVVAAIALGAMILSFGGFTRTYENFGYIVEDGKAVIVQYKDKQGVSEVTIPDEIDGRPVIGVERFGFVNTDQVKIIRIGKNIERITSWSFTNNVNLERFVVDAENTKYRDINGVLYTADGQTLLFFPNGRKGTGVDDAEPYEIPQGVVTISAQAFYKCGNLTRVNFPESLRTIEEAAFLYAEKLEAVTLPQGLLRIEKDAFSYCSRAGSHAIGEKDAAGSPIYADDALVLPASLEYVGDYAFYNAVYIKKLTVNKTEAFTAEHWGLKWYPVQNGDIIPGCKIEYQ